VLISLAVLAAAAAVQALIFVLTGSVALLADLIHNAGDALTAIPVGAAFLLRSERAERWAGYAVVLAIFISACVALVETIQRLIHPEELSHLWALAGAGLIGFLANELAARVRLRAGRRLRSPALVADGKHARVDGFVSLGVVASAALVALGWEMGDPIVGLLITLVILRVTWDSWHTVPASTFAPLSCWSRIPARAAVRRLCDSQALAEPADQFENVRTTARRSKHSSHSGLVRRPADKSEMFESAGGSAPIKRRTRLNTRLGWMNAFLSLQGFAVFATPCHRKTGLHAA
jgi:hypothetical protein